MQTGQRMRRNHIEPFGDAQSGTVAGHDKRGKAFGARGFAGAREIHIEIGDAAIGNPGFFSNQHIMITVAARGHRDIGNVGAGLRLGQREGGDGLARSRALEPGALLHIAKQADRAGAQPLHGEGEVGEAVVARQRFAHQTERAHIERRGDQRIGRSVHEPAVAAELGDQLAACGIDIAVIDRQMDRAPALDGIGQRAMALGEKRPGQERTVSH